MSSDWNKDLKVKFTVQDPCNQVRKTYGDAYAEDLRYVVKRVVGEENFVDMSPNRSNNYCCGGGGGALQAGYTEARREFGRLKADQILATEAAYCITPCHNCHSQVHDLSEHFKGDGTPCTSGRSSASPWAAWAKTSAPTSDRIWPRWACRGEGGAVRGVRPNRGRTPRARSAEKVQSYMKAMPKMPKMSQIA